MLTAYCLYYLILIYIYTFLFDTQFSSDLHEYRDFGTPKIFIVTRYLFAFSFFCYTACASTSTLARALWFSYIHIILTFLSYHSHRLGQQPLREQSPRLAAARLHQLYPCLRRKLQRKRSSVHLLRVRREGQQEQRRATQRHVPHLWSQGRRQGEGEGKG